MKTKFFQLLSVVAIATVSFNSCTTDACKDVDCGLYGECVDGDCVCDTGYEGVNCDTPWSAYFLGTYAGLDTCGFQYESIISGGASATTLSISNIFGLAASGTATVISNTAGTIQIPSQTVNGYVVSGSGALVGDVITIDYTIDGDDCMLTYTRP